MQLPEKALTALAVACFAWVGMALRLGIALLFKPLDFGLTTASASRKELCVQHTTASGYFLQNILGCFLMAVVVRHKPALNPYLAAGLSTGLCGSLTTWATWMEEEAFTMLAGKVWMAFVSLVCMLCVSIGSFQLGWVVAGGGMGTTSRKETASSAAREDGEAVGTSSEETSAEDSSAEEGGTAAVAHTLHLLTVGGAVAITVATWGALASLGHTPGLVDMALSPFGALLRWVLSLGNKRTAPLPVFTLVANTLGCVVDALFAVLAGRVPGAAEILASVGTGFGGSLSTVSTFVGELLNEEIGGLRIRITYFGVTFASAMGILLPVYAYAHC